jgi:hypothetical protein
MSFGLLLPFPNRDVGQAFLPALSWLTGNMPSALGLCAGVLRASPSEITGKHYASSSKGINLDLVEYRRVI